MKRSGKKNRPKRFLVVSTTGIGDTLMGTPALRALKRSFPDSQVDLLVKSQSAGLLYGNPYVGRILRYRNNPFSRGLLFLKAYGTDYDHILVFHANEDLWKILRMVRYGDCYSRQSFEDPARRVIRLDSIPRHSIQKRLALVEKVGGKDSKDYRYDYFLPHLQFTGQKRNGENGGFPRKTGWWESSPARPTGLNAGPWNLSLRSPNICNRFMV